MTATRSDQAVESLILDYQQRLQTTLDTLLPKGMQVGINTLHDAARYSCLNGGKRFRPLLVYLTGQCFGATVATLDIPAVAVELIHCYSLVHDDLPAMDNDDLRRGKPTCHKAFGYATAILVGDALQTQAFELLSQPSTTLTAEQQLSMIQSLARASGMNGMVAGQALDLHFENKKADAESLKLTHQLKTGALIQASVALGGIAANCNPGIMAQLSQFSATLGLAFQIQDDVLDQTSTTEVLGKTAGSDASNHKSTFATTQGLSAAKKQQNQLFSKALKALEAVPAETHVLRSLVQYIQLRES